MAISGNCISLFRITASAVFCAAILAGCDELTGSSDTGAESATVRVPGGQLKIEERDVAAPDVYQLSANGLWDGRPSLGGIWVAVPDNVEPDRVRITNLANNRQVVGSLFRKEVSIQGPPILVSAAAADAIGLTAGSPTKLEVVVLRRETVEVAAPPEPEIVEEADPEETDTAVALAVEPAEATGITTAELETSVLDAIDATATTATAAAATTVDTAVAAAPAATAPVSAVKNPYIQVATVTTPKAANDIVRKLQGGGVSSETRISTNGGKSSFKVVVGPVATADEQTAKLKAVRGLGFKDAFPTK